MIAREDVDLSRYDLILVNTSGGKDSSVAAWYVRQLAELAGVLDRVVLVHATFPEEWPGTVELIKEQARHLGGLPVEVVSRGESLLDYVRRRRKWPGPTKVARYCTSDMKRAPIDKVITRLTPKARRWWRVLNVMGIRADESRQRAKYWALGSDDRRTNSVRRVDQWYPIFHLSTPDVWSVIREHGIPTHPAYALGMPRLSCRFCIFAPRPALILAGYHNRELLEEYVAVEREIGHRFKNDLAIESILDAVNAGERPPAIPSWEM